MSFNTIPEIIEDIRLGKMVIIIDDEDRENEGDLLMAATHVSPEAINFMITHAKGLVCLTMTEERCKRLGLSPIDLTANQYGTAFTLSIEAKRGVTTGVSAKDRAKTIQTAISSTATADDIVKPGHVFPIMARNGGVLYRAGHTEAGCDLARLAGLEPAAVICEVTNADGTMARRDDLIAFAKEHHLKIGTIADLIAYRIRYEKTIEEIECYPVETEFGILNVHVFKEFNTQSLHFALVKGTISPNMTTAVRVHSFDMLKDLIGTPKGFQKHWTYFSALQEIAQAKQGVLVLIGQKTALSTQDILKSLSVEKQEPTIPEKPYREIGIGAQILNALGVSDMALLSSPTRFNALAGFNLNIKEYIPFKEEEVCVNPAEEEKLLP